MPAEGEMRKPGYNRAGRLESVLEIPARIPASDLSDPEPEEVP
jgi:hypothetical protein